MRRPLTLLIVLAVVGLAGWVADNWARGQAEDRVAAAAQARLGLDQEPEVALGGFPFSTALVTKTVPSARLSAASVPLAVSGHGVQLTGVLVDSDRISLDGDQVRLARVTATGVLPYGDLAQLTGVPTSYGGDGRLRLNYTARVGGRQFSVWVSAVPGLAPDGTSIEFTGAELDSETSASLSRKQLDRLAKSAPLQLPDGVRLTALTPAEGGVAVAALATDLSFTLA